MTVKTRYAETSVDLSTALRRQNRAIIVLFFLVIVVPPLFNWLNTREIPKVSSVSINSMQLLSPAEVCPGESLTFRYDLTFQGSGVLIRDLTLWNVDPPKTVIFSTARRFILPADITQQSLVESWRVPRTYYSYEVDAQLPLPPGNYHRQIAISSTTNEEVVDVDWVVFRVLSPEECREEMP